MNESASLHYQDRCGPERDAARLSVKGRKRRQWGKKKGNEDVFGVLTWKA